MRACDCMEIIAANHHENMHAAWIAQLQAQELAAFPLKLRGRSVPQPRAPALLSDAAITPDAEWFPGLFASPVCNVYNAQSTNQNSSGAPSSRGCTEVGETISPA